MQKITVFCSNKRPAPFLQCSHMEQYVKKNGLWEVCRTQAMPQIRTDSVAALRKTMQEIIEMTKDSRIILCAEIVGIPFTAFDMAGYGIFTSDRLEDKVLDGILEDMAASDEKARIREAQIKSAAPAETGTTGIYYLDLAALQEECPQISSKKALQDFLEHTPFVELHLVCGHIPPWLENSGKYEIRAERKDGKVQAVVTKKQC